MSEHTSNSMHETAGSAETLPANFDAVNTFDMLAARRQEIEMLPINPNYDTKEELHALQEEINQAVNNITHELHRIGYATDNLAVDDFLLLIKNNDESRLTWAVKALSELEPPSEKEAPFSAAYFNLQLKKLRTAEATIQEILSKAQHKKPQENLH